MNKRQDNILVERLKKLFFLGAIVVIVPLSIREFFLKESEDEEIAKYPRYTVGEVTKAVQVVGPSSEKLNLFTYQVGDSSYTGNEPGSLPDGQTLFLVKYSTKHPQYYKFYKQVPLLPTHIPPPEGWAEPPYRVPAEDLE